MYRTSTDTPRCEYCGGGDIHTAACWTQRTAAVVEAAVCYFGQPGCTAAIADHPGADSTYHASCPTHGPGVIQHYPGRERAYRCWHCVMAEFHGTTSA